MSSKNRVAMVLLIGFVWLLLLVGGFSLIESRGKILTYAFTVAMIFLYRFSAIKVLNFVGYSNEITTSISPTKTAVLLVIVLAWVIVTIIALDRLKLTGALQTLTWVASVVVLLTTIYLIEIRRPRQRKNNHRSI